MCCMADVVVYEENRLETLVKRVCELENYVLNLETKYLSKSRGLSIAKIVDDVHCLTLFICQVKECFCTSLTHSFCVLYTPSRENDRC